MEKYTKEAAVSPGSRIFVIDDEPVIASSLAAILRMNDFSVRFFTSPEAALARIIRETPFPRCFGRRGWGGKVLSAVL
jgi:PleD family two-component response regulator